MQVVWVYTGRSASNQATPSSLLTFDYSYKQFQYSIIFSIHRFLSSSFDQFFKPTKNRGLFFLSFSSNIRLICSTDQMVKVLLTWNKVVYYFYLLVSFTKLAHRPIQSMSCGLRLFSVLCNLLCLQAPQVATSLEAST